MTFKDLIHEERAHELVEHYAGLAGVPSATGPQSSQRRRRTFKGLLGEWRRHGVDDETIQATLASQPIAEWVVDRAVQDARA